MSFSDEDLKHVVYNDDSAASSFINELESTRKAPENPIYRGRSAELESINHKPRYGNIWIFIIVILSFNFTSSY
jgi:hypothetical protein